MLSSRDLHGLCWGPEIRDKVKCSEQAVFVPEQNRADPPLALAK